VRDLVTLQHLLREVEEAARLPHELQAYLCAQA
jgi:hypothetical protein